MVVKTEEDARCVLVGTKLDKFGSKSTLVIAPKRTYADCHDCIRKVRIYNKSTDVLLRI